MPIQFVTIHPFCRTKPAAMPKLSRISQRHAIENEVAEEQADHHQGRPEHDVEQQAPAFDCAAVQPVAADGHMGEHPERDGDHRLADQDDPAADAGHPHAPRDHRQDVGDDDAGEHDAISSAKTGMREEAR